MGRGRKLSVITGDVCAVSMVLSGGAFLVGTMVSWAFDDVKLQAFITLAAIVFVAAAIVYHVVEGS